MNDDGGDATNQDHEDRQRVGETDMSHNAERKQTQDLVTRSNSSTTDQDNLHIRYKAFYSISITMFLL